MLVDSEEENVRSCIAQKCNVVLSPDDAQYQTGERDDGTVWELVKVPYTDGSGAERTLTVFGNDATSEQWQPLVELVRDFQEYEQFVCLVGVVAEKPDEYVNFTLFDDSEVVVGDLQTVMQIVD